MKQNFQYPRTLRNYNQNEIKIKYSTKPNSLNDQKLMNSQSKAKIIRQEEKHEMNQYCILTNPPKQTKNKTNHKQSKNKDTQYKIKKNPSSSRLQKAIKKSQQKQKNINKVGPLNIVHCRSLQKLQIISNDRSSQIYHLILQKSKLQTQNSQLKAKLFNPSFKQQQLHSRILTQQKQIQELNQRLKTKDQIARKMESQLRDQIRKLKITQQSQIARIYHNDQYINYNKVEDILYPILPTNKINQPPKTSLQTYGTKNHVNNHLNYKAYIGQDGYQRRVYISDDQKLLNDQLKPNIYSKFQNVNKIKLSTVDAHQQIHRNIPASYKQSLTYQSVGAIQSSNK